MTKQKFLLRISLKMLLLIFLVGFMSIQSISAQGANAPEAASFEPVDATDMVNLVTGNLSYVLPILNVPSPEGGYPIALSYHAGIAMDQEASWVGLGWSINPGSINRAVNGYPDDWGKSNYSEFFYDQGWTEDYYSLSIGVSVSHAVSVGLGLSWGSNQSLGGFVQASIGLGKNGNGLNMGGQIGTNGASINAGYGFKGGQGIYASIGTSGVGVGYGYRTGGIRLGVSLNYNYSEGLSGGVSISQKTGNSKALNGNPIGKRSSLGINFSSKGTSINGSINGFGASISNHTNSNGGGYDVNISSTSFSIPTHMFYIGWSHTKVKISRFKYDNLYTSGTLYPVEANKSQANEVVAFSNKMEVNYFMDVNVMQPFLQSSRYDDLIDGAKNNDRNNLTLPNYDNYTVSAQGLSGTMNPYTYKELTLSARGSGEQNNDNKYITYLNNSHDFYITLEGSTGNTPNEIDKKHFTFSNTYNSYLKLTRNDIIRSNPNITDSETLMSYYGTTNNNSNGFLNGKRKKEGNNITTYTNKEIREGNLNGFMEAREGTTKLNRNDTDVFLDNGIGAYKVTTMDGKTYYYSLPVYQFESTFKNYNNKKPNGDLISSEDENFFEINKTKPYATHWLLTAITGPDYYDKNEDGKVDKEDYGYWVEFDYGKWSDGYTWQTPIEEIVDKDDATKKSYAYSWGRKQVYYLDAIKTRSHTALFVKELREDNKGFFKSIGSYKYSNNVTGDNYRIFNKDTYRKEILVADVSPLYKWSGKKSRILITDLYFYQIARGYIYKAEKEKSLKLNKILLIKNNLNLLNIINKSTGTITNNSIGTASNNQFYFNLTRNGTGRNFGNWSFSSYKLKHFNLHQHQNVLDIKDIEGLDLESHAIQVIDFEHDYSLANNAPNADTGRLTLKKVSFKGKQGAQVVPPYKFGYENYSTTYIKDDIDAWGYHKTNPSLWSLNQITMPTGGKINIDYGSDQAISAIEHVHNLTATKENGWYNNGFTATDSSGTLDVKIGDKVYISYSKNYVDQELYYYGPGTVNSIISTNKYSVTADNGIRGLHSTHGTENLKLSITFNPILNNSVRPIGGLRTNSITVNNGLKDIITTEYVYKNGITSYSPSKKPKGIPYVSELPAPMVLYGEVEMKTKDGNDTHLGSTVYEFETLESKKQEKGYIFSLGEAFRVKENQNTTFQNGTVIANKYTIESRLGNIGRIKSVKSYNSESHLLHQSENFYKKDLDADGEIGVTQESYKSYKRVLKDDVETFYVSSTSKINYPTVLESVTQTQGNFTITKYFDKHDFLTGQAIESRTYGSDGKGFKSKIVPAYTKYPLMGSKVDDINNKNMLTQAAASYSYLLNTDGSESIISAGISTWKNNWNYWDYKGALQLGNDKGPDIWRKHKSFVWKGAINEDGIYADYTGEDDRFNWGIGAIQASSSKWQKVSETTRYDHYSMPLEQKDINGNYAATKMCDKNTKVLATSNAAYTEMYYCSLEYDYEGEVEVNGYRQSPGHTGKYSRNISAGQKAFEVRVPASTARNTEKKQRFKVTVWVKKAQKEKVKIRINYNGLIDFKANETQITGDWAMLTGYITIPTSQTTVAITCTSGRAELDDFRLHPITASMTSYVYNQFDEVTFITGANGLSTKYVYDDAGKLKETWVEVLDNAAAGIEGGFKRISKNSYNYKNQ